MGLAKESLMQVQAQLCERIDALATQLPHLTVSRLAHEVDALRRVAESHGLAPVVEIAHRLESELAASRGLLMVASFLETMRDAVGCERLDPAATQAYLAAISRRLYG
jgi:hypothetical protein